MGKYRRGGYVFITWKGDHPPRHVHVYRDGTLIVKWDLDNQSDEGRCDAAHSGADSRARSRGPAVKIRSVRHNNRKKVFEVGTSTKTLVFPFSKAEPTPTTEDPVTELSVDAEAGREAFSYVLHSGRIGTVHVEQVLKYNQDPTYLRDSCCTADAEAQKQSRRARSQSARSCAGWDVCGAVVSSSRSDELPQVCRSAARPAASAQLRR